ncbi:type II toxin-antitoxin system Phd/YefM family antitoxin [Comamonas flocculans]|uniref:Type II toxin-antitoxin system Phd/YefM family antitoxin n=1 Tax=Comamonas flocculans TaxID=2597701 RepID=A0A5B8RUV1_9BURK|nr:type II toxin-antitoxin system Phd/YefM family antitoxin [Comamonas flocculans]QEA13301.1 type II toxin-antitoxin system Phd/YefM family antitoxin [Comamonas flocculans]
MTCFDTENGTIGTIQYRFGCFMNTLTIAEIKRRGMAAIGEKLQHGPVHVLKRNRPAAVMLSEEEYRRLTSAQSPLVPGMTAAQWLLAQTQAPTGHRERAEIDAALAEERAW